MNCKTAWIGVAIFLVLSCAAADEQQVKVDVLLIGTSGTLHPDRVNPKTEQAGLETLKSFIKDETGLTNEIVRQDNWRELADKMAKGQLHLGVFHGYEFAWAQDKHPDLKPVALAFNVHHYPIACVVVRRDSQAKGFGDLQGQSLDIPDTGDRFLNLFVDHQCKAAGKNAAAFFSKITSQENFEDALDRVVDGVVQVAVVDQAALEGYERRKPGRFNKLKEVARSQPFPPTVLAHYGTVLDQPTLKRLQDGVLGASRKEKGQTVLTLFGVTGFETAPEDFGKVVAETQKTYEPSVPKTKGNE